jgi:cathepsin C
MKCFIALVLAVQLASVAADLPIHCIHKQTVGTWYFQRTDADKDNKELCGYKHPDLSSDHFGEKYNYQFTSNPKLDFYSSLSAPNVVQDHSSNRTGEFTMVYDEGFEVNFSGEKYFSFFKYTAKAGVDLSSEEVSDYVSDCGTTMVGWYHGADNKGFGCYKAYKVAKPGDSKPLVLSQEQQFFRPAIHHSNIVSRTPTHNDDTIWEPDYSYIEMVNSNSDSSWQAKAHDQFLGKSMRHMHSLAGRRTFQRKLGKNDQGRVGVRAAPHTEDEEKAKAALPKEYDWRSMNGQTYVSSVKNQGSCGSCYAMASMAVFESRFRIATKNQQKPDLSAQDVLACSAVNQGCEGGYPFLVGKYGEEFGFVEEQCLPYTGSDSSKCEDECHDKPRYYIKNYRYVGGYYGACNEYQMMKEIHENGPIMVAFEAPSDLYYYDKGVYTGPQPKEELQGEANVNKWQQTNHAVVAVGWGEEAGVPYWVLKNTWGASWGDSGYFKIKRGSDECAMESMAVAGDVIPL